MSVPLRLTRWDTNDHGWPTRIELEYQPGDYPELMHVLDRAPVYAPMSGEVRGLHMAGTPIVFVIAERTDAEEK